MHLNKYYGFLFVLFLSALGFLVYIYRLEIIPSGFYIDEALPGYNSYSILLTGRDEYGKFMPAFLRFYGSYNPPFFTYSLIPSISLFGLSVFSVRIVSALAGLLSVIPIYYLLKSSGVVKNKLTIYVSLIFFIITPWLVLHSRVGYEISLAYLIFSIGILFTWLGLKRPNLLIIGFAILSLSTYAAYTERFLVPIFAGLLLIVFRKKLWTPNYKVYTKKAIIIAILIQIPHILLLTTPAFFPKSDEIAVLDVTNQADKISFLPNQIAYFLAYLREFLSQYATYFSPRSLFFLPDPDLQRSIPELSVFYFWMIVPYFAGLYYIWQKKSSDFSRFLLLVLLLAPIPAALTKDPFSTHRAMPHLLGTFLVISLGIDRIIYGRQRKTVIISSFLIFIGSLILLWRSYFVLLPKERAKYWGYGVDKIADEIMSRSDEHFVLDQARVKPFYMQLAFFMKYPPDKFQKSVNTNIRDNYYANTDFDSEYKFANLETRGVDWKRDPCIEQILVGDELAISDQQALEHKLEKVFEIRSPVDELLFQGFKTNPQEKCKV